MPPYLRLPEPEVITQRFWGCRTRNPTCGYISWDIGTIIFAWGNIVYGAIFSIACVLIFFLHLTVSAPSTPPNDIMTGLKDGGKLSQQDVEWFQSLYLHKSVTMVNSIIFFSFLFFTFWWYVSWNLRKAAVGRDQPKLKKYYVLLLSLMIVFLILTLWEGEFVWSEAFLIDIPCFIFQIMGLMFTHGYIASLSSPVGEDSQVADQNQMEFNGLSL